MTLIFGVTYMYDIGFEFDEMYRLVSLMGFSGVDLEKIIAVILHSANEALRNEVNGGVK